MKDVTALCNSHEYDHMSKAECPLVVMSCSTPLKAVKYRVSCDPVVWKILIRHKCSGFIRWTLFLFFLIAKSMSINICDAGKADTGRL